MSSSNEALLNAMHSRNSEKVKTMLEGGANPNFNCEKNNPLLIACINGYSEMVEAFLRYGADVNLKIGKKHVPINQAIVGYYSDYEEKCKHLPKTSADFLQIIMMLIKHGAILDESIDNEGKPPLKVALKYYFDCMNLNSAVWGIHTDAPDKRPIKMLVEYGASTAGIITVIRTRYQNDRRNKHVFREVLINENDYERVIELIRTTKQLCIYCDDELSSDLSWKGIKALFSPVLKKCNSCGFNGYS